MDTIPAELAHLKTVIESTKTRTISIETHSTNKDLPVHQSKIGGVPYWPHSMPLPEIDGKPTKLMAQINFDQLTKEGISLPFYPTTGLLQFYCLYNDEMYGLEFSTSNNSNSSDPTKSTNIKVVYHSQYDEEQHPAEELVHHSLNNDEMPFSEELSMQFSLEEEYLGLGDEYNSRIVYPNLTLDDELAEFFYDELSNEGSKIGGYAFFTQGDPRTEFKQEDEWLLLLQLDSDDNMMWGDSGVANWFIKKTDLINKNFDHIYFTWDCC